MKHRQGIATKVVVVDRERKHTGEIDQGLSGPEALKARARRRRRLYQEMLDRQALHRGEASV